MLKKINHFLLNIEFYMSILIHKFMRKIVERPNITCFEIIRAELSNCHASKLP